MVPSSTSSGAVAKQLGLTRCTHYTFSHICIITKVTIHASLNRKPLAIGQQIILQWQKEVMTVLYEEVLKL